MPHHSLARQGLTPGLAPCGRSQRSSSRTLPSKRSPRRTARPRPRRSSGGTCSEGSRRYPRAGRRCGRPASRGVHWLPRAIGTSLSALSRSCSRAVRYRAGAHRGEHRRVRLRAERRRGGEDQRAQPRPVRAVRCGRACVMGMLLITALCPGKCLHDHLFSAAREIACTCGLRDGLSDGLRMTSLGPSRGSETQAHKPRTGRITRLDESGFCSVSRQ